MSQLSARRVALLAAIVIGVISLDQATKTWAERALADGPRHIVWTLQLVLTFNRGAAFSIGTGLTPFLTAAAVIIVVSLLGLSRTTTTLLGVIALGMVLGGAGGNLVDRLVRDNHLAVIDWIDFQWWPVFNVADASLVCGALLLVWSQRTPAPAPASTAPPT